MKLYQAIDKCHVRSAVIRKSKPNVKYWKNSPDTIEQRVPLEDIDAEDWEEYDPRDDDEGSLSAFND